LIAAFGWQVFETGQSALWTFASTSTFPLCFLPDKAGLKSRTPKAPTKLSVSAIICQRDDAPALGRRRRQRKDVNSTNEHEPPPPGASFPVGSLVRVKHNTPDPDYPDIPLGGWVGEVTDIDESTNPPLYEILWSDDTIDAMPEVYVFRCERDDMEVESCTLPESVLEIAPDGPVHLQQPTDLKPRPLNLEDPLDRARDVLALTSDDELPEMDPGSLRAWREALTGQLKFPWSAAVEPVQGPGLQPVLVLRLLPVEESDADTGLLAEVTLGEKTGPIPLLVIRPTEGDPARPLVLAYQAWVLKNDIEEEGQFTAPADVISLLVRVAIVMLGMLVGGVLATEPEAPWWAAVGASIGAILGLVLGAAIELRLRQRTEQHPGVLIGGLLGIVLGGLVGSVLAVIASAWLGAIIGAVAGSALATVLHIFGKKAPTGTLTVLGLWLGTLIYCMVLDAWTAVGGIAAGALAALLPLALLQLLRKRAEEQN